MKSFNINTDKDNIHYLSEEINLLFHWKLKLCSRTYQPNQTNISILYTKKYSKYLVLLTFLNDHSFHIKVLPT